MDAIVTAGGVPTPEDPLYEYTRGAPKALLEVGGKPMVQWVLDAISNSQTVSQVVLVGLMADSGLTCAKPLTFVPSHESMLLNVRAGVEKVIEMDSGSHHILVVSSDIPSITTEMVDWLVNNTQQSDHDIYYTVVTREVMEGRFPTSHRSYTRLKDVEVCGGDMNVIRAITVTANEQLWEKIITARKNVLKQAALIGYGTLVLLLLRRLELGSGIKRVCQRLGITGRVVFSPYAEIAMDVDKPHQLEILRADLSSKVLA